MIPKGTILHSSEPFGYSLNEHARKSHCDYCLKRESIKMCKGCYYVGYCDEECQVRAWSDHRQECKDIKANILKNEIISNEVRLLAKVIRKIKKTSHKEALFSLEPSDCFSKDDLERKEVMKELYEDLCNFMGSENVPKDIDLFDIISRIYLNTFPVFDVDFLCVGYTIHLIPGLKHSCNPNAVFAHSGRKIYITALQDLPELDWNNITAAFIYDFFEIDDRLWNAGLEFKSECSCEKCTDGQLKSALCPNRNCQGACNIDDEACPTCGIKLSDDFKSSYNEVLELTLKCLNSKREHLNQKLLQACFKKLSKIAQPTNCALVRVTERLYMLDEMNGHWMRAINYLEMAIKGFEYYFTEYNFGVGLLYYKLATFRIRLDNGIEGYYKALDETRRIFTFIYGDSLGHRELSQLLSRTMKMITQNSQLPKKKCNFFSNLYKIN